MGFAALGYLCCVLCVMVLLPRTSYSQEFISSRATYYRAPGGLGTPSGACGFGEYGRLVNDAKVAAVSGLYKNGTGCGACYQVRCKAPKLCTDKGVEIVVTDYGAGDNTDFILSTLAYKRMARPKMAAELLAYSALDVEYKRIPCSYAGDNLLIRVHEQSRFPDYLAIAIVYPPGLNEILAVAIRQDPYKKWIGMTRAYGAVFDLPNPPTGALQLRFQVRDSAGVKWVKANNVIPGDWEPGVVYDSGLHLY